MVWHGMVWYDMVWYGVVCSACYVMYVMLCMAWHGVAWYGMYECHTCMYVCNAM